MDSARLGITEKLTMNELLDNPRMTAWLLGELPAQEAAEMERLVAADPALQLAVREKQLFHTRLSTLLGAEKSTLEPRQREVILRAAKNDATPPSTSIATLSPRRSHASWIVLATAAAVIIGAWIGLRHPLSKQGGELALDSQISREIALLPSVAPDFPSEQTSAAVAVGGSSAMDTRTALMTQKPNEFLVSVAKQIANQPLPQVSELPPVGRRGLIDAAAHPRASLPILAGTASWNWTKRSILEGKTLPNERLVRREEMINAFALETNASILHQGIEFRVEVAHTANQQGRYYMAITMRNSNHAATSVALEYLPAMVDRYRLIGFDVDMGKQQVSKLLPAGTMTTVMLELDAPRAINQVGSLHTMINGQGMDFPAEMATAASASMKHLSLIADFAEWLRQPQSSTAALAQAIAVLEPQLSDPQRLSSLAVIKQAINLADNK
jgi:anti-sigma factor RsiW